MKISIIIGLCNGILFKGIQPQLPNLTATDWDEVLSFAAEQGLLPVIAPLLKDLRFDDEASRMMLVEWYVTAQANVQDYQIRIRIMCQLAGILAKEDIDVMFMKGATLAQLYPEPESRVFDDIDFYLYGQWQKGTDVMKRHGIEVIPFSHHHIQASYHDILLENHYDFVERMYHRQNLIIDDELKKLSAKEGRTIKAQFLGKDYENAYVMTPTMNAIFLMRHMAVHFVSETIILRMLYDWALFLKHHDKNVDWLLVADLYDRVGMTEFVGLIQYLVKIKLGVEYAECPVFSYDEEKAEKLWHSIAYPPKQDPYMPKSLKYYLFEARTFWNNRWKHQIVYPGESYAWLFCQYAWSGTKQMLKLKESDLCSV